MRFLVGLMIVLAMAASADAQATGKSVLLNGFEDAKAWGITHKQRMVWGNTEGARAALTVSILNVKEGRGCAELGYEFVTDQRDGVQISLREHRTFPDKDAKPPDRIGLWAYGDLSGHTIRYRFTDDKGKLWEMTFPGAETIDWTGWRYLEGPLASVEGLAWPARFGSLDITDSHPSFRGRGTIKLDGLSYCWLAEAERDRPLAQAGDCVGEGIVRATAVNFETLQARLADVNARLKPEQTREHGDLRALAAEAATCEERLVALKKQHATPELMREQGKLGCGLLALATRIEDGLTDLTLRLAKAREQRFVIFSRPLMAEILPDTAPGADEIAAELRIAATPGEFRAASLSVFTAERIEGLHLSATDLRGPQRTLPASTLAIRAVKVWPQQRLASQRGDTVDPVMTPELLEDANGIFVPARSTQQFWLVARVPDDAPPGPYEGKLLIKSHNLKADELPLTLTVHPFKLKRHPDKFRGMFYHPMSAGARGSPASRLADFKDMAEHGMDTVIDQNPHDYFRAEGKGETARLDFNGVAKVMAEFKDAGLRGPVVLFPFRGAVSLYHGARTGGAGTIYDAEYRESYTRVVRMIEERFAAEKWPVPYDYTFDEPPDFEKCRPFFETLRAAKAHVAASDFRFQFSQKMIPYCDLFIYSGGLLFENNPNRDGNMKAFLELAPRFPRMLWGSYVQTWYDGPYGWQWARLTFGVPFLKSPVHSAWGHIYMAPLSSDPFWDFGGHKAAMTVYPSPAGSIPTIQWEMVREGANDAHYVYTLQAAIEESRKTKPEAAAKAERVLKEVLSRYNELDARETMQRLTPGDYEALRAKVAEAIVTLVEVR